MAVPVDVIGFHKIGCAKADEEAWLSPQEIPDDAPLEEPVDDPAQLSSKIIFFLFVSYIPTATHWHFCAY